MTVQWQTAGNQILGSYELAGGVKAFAIICENRIATIPFSAVVFRSDRRRIRPLGVFPDRFTAIDACEVALKKSSETMEHVA